MLSIRAKRGQRTFEWWGSEMLSGQLSRVKVAEEPLGIPIVGRDRKSENGDSQEFK